MVIVKPRVGLRLIREKINTAIDTSIGYKWWAAISAKSGLARIKNRAALEKRRVLLLGWLFPPNITAGAHRLTALVKHGSELGWKFSVFCGPHTGAVTQAGAYLLQAVPQSVSVTRVLQSLLQTSYNWFPRMDGGFLNALATYDLACEVICEAGPSMVVASGPPFHSFVAGYYIARQYRAKLVLDYRDEWTECPFDFVHPGNADRSWERRCLGSADAVFFTTQRQLDHQVLSFPQLARHKCYVIPNGWEPEDFVPLGEDEKGKHKGRSKLVLSFVGTLGNHALPGEFLSVLERLLAARPDLADRLVLRFIGYKSQIAVSQLTGFPYRHLIELVQTVPKPEAARIMQQSSALLLFNNNQMERYIPAKLYDYLGSGRPLIVCGQGGEIEDIVTSLRAGYVIRPGDDVALEKTLDEIASGETVLGNREGIEEWLGNHTRLKMTLRMLEVFERLLTEA